MSTTTSESQANVAPAASAKGKQEPTTAASSSNSNGAPQTEQKPPQRTPKLAPAPVPQQTPWKATPVSNVADLGDRQKKPATVVAAAAAAVSNQKNGKDRDQHSSNSKRAPSTTGKEKWVPFAPAPIPVQQNTPGGSSNGNGPNGGNVRRTNKRQNGQQNGQQGNGMKNRRNPMNNDKRLRGVGHQRSQSRARGDDNNSASNHSDAANGANAGSAAGGASHSGAAGSNHSNSTGHKDLSGDMEKLSVDERSGDRRERYSGNPNQNNNQQNRYNNSRGSAPRKNGRVGNNRMSYYPGGFIPPPGAVPFMSVPMMPMAPVIPPAAASGEFILPAIARQVDYYFSTENLCKDMFLRKHMNDEGLVPISVIAGFKRMQMIAPNTDAVSKACAIAQNVEVIGSKIRAANMWQAWLLPRSDRLPDGLDDSHGPAPSANGEQEPKFKVEQAVPFVPRNEK